MASESAKRRIKRNAQVKNRMQKKIFISLVAVVLITLLRKRSIWSITTVIPTLIEILIYYVSHLLTNTSVVKTASGLEIKDKGIDLTQRGAVYILKDMINISVGVKIAGAIFGPKAFIGLFLVPVTAYYEIFMRRETRQRHKQS
ncbi:hypothetical protein NEOKW01_0959 [Nematocida sp. AWRm80]|nr:hypothetical protein NEOKW01_0959 [Nematocida sp. AWRm80]